MIGIIGKVGSGKSSFLAAVTAEMERLHGKVLFAFINLINRVDINGLAAFAISIISFLSNRRHLFLFLSMLQFKYYIWFSKRPNGNNAYLYLVLVDAK